jgi:hypothetical protein
MLDRDGSCKAFCGQKVIGFETEETIVAVLVCRINRNLPFKRLSIVERTQNLRFHGKSVTDSYLFFFSQGTNLHVF